MTVNLKKKKNGKIYAASAKVEQTQGTKRIIDCR